MFYVIVLSIIALTNAALETPPKITNTFEPRYYLKQTAENVKFQCSASGNPNPKMYWKFDGQRLYSTQRKKIYDNGTLEFVSIVAKKEPGKPELPDWGRYRCFAENKLGKAMATSFDLYEADNVEFTAAGIKPFDGEEGESMEIPCVGKNDCTPKEECKVEWKIKEGTDTAVVVNERIAIDTAGNLHFSYLSKDLDQKNTATDFYACAVWNELKGTLVRGSPMYLQITKPFGSGSNVAPNLAYNSGTVKALIGSRAVIQCVFTGKPAMDYIRWYKRGPSGTDVLLNTDPGSRYSIDDFDRKLVINNVAEMDEASYICKANNGDDVTKEKSGSNFLDVQSPPIFVPNGKPRDLTLPEGADAIFTCDARSLPGETAPNFPDWYRNGELITGSSKYQFSNDKKKLTIKNVMKPTQNPSFNPRDVAAYVCSVTNGNGTVYGSGYVNVIEPIKILQTLPDTLEILPGEIKSISVDATTDPELSLGYTWSFTDKDNRTFNENEMRSLPFSDYFSFTTDMKNLTINAETLEGSQIYTVVGTYQVVVGHDYEKKTITSKFTTDVTIKPPTEPVISSAGFDFWIIAVILGIIVLFIVILLIICLCYRNRGGTYPLGKKEINAGHDPEKELKDSGFHDLSRADDFDNPGYDNVSLSSMKPIESDEDSMGEYGGDLDISKFNEDGSFIGLYTDTKDSKKAPTQSTV